MKFRQYVLAVAFLGSAIAMPFAWANVASEMPGTGVSAIGEDCGCSMTQESADAIDQFLNGSPGNGDIKPLKTAYPVCPSNCVNYEFPPQFKCRDTWLWEECDDADKPRKIQERKRWKWVCPTVTYVSCGSYYDNGQCCAVRDDGPGCAGNSGLPICEGIP